MTKRKSICETIQVWKITSAKYTLYVWHDDGDNGTNVFFCSEYFECAKWAKEFSNEMCVRAGELCVCVLLSQCERPESELERRDHRHRYRTAANRQLPVITGYKHRPYCALVCLFVSLCVWVCNCAPPTTCRLPCSMCYNTVRTIRLVSFPPAWYCSGLFSPKCMRLLLLPLPLLLIFFIENCKCKYNQKLNSYKPIHVHVHSNLHKHTHTHTRTCNTHSYLPSICNNSNNYSVTNCTQMLFNRFEIYWKCESKCKCNGTNSAHQHRSSSLRIEYVARISIFLSHLQIYSFQLRLPRLLVVVVVTEWLFANKSVRAYDEAGE